MKAVVMTGYGGNEVLKLHEMPRPLLKDEDILIKVHAASCNPVDFKIRNGKLRAVLPFKFPHILGNDCAGVVEEMGRHVTRFKVGDLVYARPDKMRAGTFAQYVSVRESDAALKPKNISMEEAASFPLAGLTAWQGLFDIAKLKAGDKVLIHAGAGGVGSLAIQLAKAKGLYVATTASGVGLTLVKQLGADKIINYREEKFEESGELYDAVLDTVGADTLERSFKVVKEGGFVLSIAGPPNLFTAKQLELNFFLSSIFCFLSRKISKLARQKKVTYIYYFMQPSGEELFEMARLIEEGKVKPIVDKVFPLEKTPDALSYLETGRAKGKVIIKVQ